MNHLLPNKSQTLLLKACLSEDQEAIQYFEKWLELLPFDFHDIKEVKLGLPQVYDRLDFASQRLLGILYHNLNRVEYRHPAISSLKSYSKYIWSRNQLLLSQLTELGKKLEEAGLEAIPFKGISMVNHYYTHMGERPIADLDICVKPESLEKTAPVLESLGWFPKLSFQKVRSFHKTISHSITLKKQHFELDLHQRFVQYWLTKETIMRFWDMSTKQSPGLRRLNRTHEFYCTILHGFKFDFVGSLRWATDAVILIREFEQKDWEEVYFLIKHEHYNPILYTALKFFEVNHFVDIPKWILSALEQNKSADPSRERLMKLGTTNKQLNGFQNMVFFYFTARIKSSSFFSGISNLLVHYKIIWGKQNYFQVFGRAFLLLFDKTLFPEKKTLTKDLR